jgi:ankyrin repeat protein
VVIPKKKGSAFFALAILSLASAWGGSIYDDIRGNDLPALSRKVELLGASLAVEPYLAYYFRNAKEIRKPMFDYLVEHGADPNMPDAAEVCPIHWAIKNFGAEEVAALLAAGASPNSSVRGKSLEIGDIHSDFLAGKGYGVLGLSARGSIWNPIALSVYYKKPEILSLFLDYLDPAASAWLWTAEDAPKDQLSLIELPFWKKQFDPDGVSAAAARCFAILWRKNASLPEAQRIQLPIDYGGALIATLEDDLPALKKYLAGDMEDSVKYLPYAIVGGSLDCLDFLMRYNDLNAQSFATAFDLDLVHGTPKDSVPLYAYAMMNGDFGMLQWFGDRGADFNKAFRYDWQAAGGATMHGQSGALSAAIRMNLGTDFAAYLLSKGADPNAAEGSTPLFLALSANDDDLASLLLDAGANPNARVVGKPVLSQAAMTASPAILKKCLDKKGNVALPDSYGWTALHYAVFAGDLEKIKILVDAKASLSARTSGAQRWGLVDVPYGSTPADVARIVRKSANADSQQRNFDKIIEFLAGLQKPTTKK